MEKEKRKGRPRRGCTLWIVIGIISVGLVWHFVLRPVFESGFGYADTRPVPGDPARFDPVASITDIRTYAGESVKLISIDAYYVRSDGTMDLTAESYRPRVEYEFVREVPPPPDAPPVGAGGTTSGNWFEKITIEAYRPGQWWSVTSGSTSYSYMNQGMEREVADPVGRIFDQTVPNPACSFKDLWEVVLTRDAPPDAVAVITYDAAGYEFDISNTPIDLHFDAECRLDRDRSGPVSLPEEIIDAIPPEIMEQLPEEMLEMLPPTQEGP